MRILIILLFTFNIAIGQNFTYSGFIYNANGTGAVNVPIQVYKRTTPTLTGFTSQQNYNGHSYYRSTGNAFWTDARQACANMGGYLVTVTSAAENNFLFGLWPSGWIGLTDEVVEGQWRWVTGEAYSYTSWNPGEPNNAGNEDYVQFVGGGRWNDLPNGVALPYVIEFDYIVTFTSWVLHRTVYTDATGRYTINETSNPATEWYIQITAPAPVTTLSLTDMQNVSNIILGRSARRSLHWNMYDVNGDGRITISDQYYINLRRTGSVSNWITMAASRLFNTTQYNSLNTGTTDLRATITGVSSFTINSPVSGTTNANYYLIAPGYRGQVNY
jgi:hypothetical protein